MDSYDLKTRTWTCPVCGHRHHRPQRAGVLRCICGKLAQWFDLSLVPVSLIQRPNGPRMSCPPAELALAQGVDVHWEA